MSSLQNTKVEVEVVECPICYEEINQLKNCVTTECGHQFHCSCLMQNSAINGFACPMCRSTMAEDDEEEEEEGEYEEDEEEEIDDDNALASFRMFHQQLAGEEVEEEPFEEEAAEADEAEEEEETIIKPTATFIAAKLLTQGFTMKDLVNCLLVEHEEYDVELAVNDRYSDQMFGKFRQIISNYPREMREQVEAEERLAQGHQSSRQRLRTEVEMNIGCLQNRYHVLEDEDEDEEEV